MFSHKAKCVWPKNWTGLGDFFAWLHPISVLTKVQIEELDSTSVEDHGMSSQQERSDEPGNMNSEIREEVRHIAVKP